MKATIHILPSVPAILRPGLIIKLLRNRLEWAGSTSMASPSTPEELALIHESREEYIQRNHSIPGK